MDFLLNKEEKIKAIEFSIKELEKHLISRLTVANIDFDSFDPDQFNPQEGSALDSLIMDTIQKIKFLQQKKVDLEQ